MQRLPIEPTKVLRFHCRGTPRGPKDAMVDLWDWKEFSPRNLWIFPKPSDDSVKEARKKAYRKWLDEKYQKDPKAVLFALHRWYDALKQGYRVCIIIPSQSERWVFDVFQEWWLVLHDVVRDTRPV